MAINPNPAVRNVVYPILDQVGLLWFVLPNDPSFGEMMRTNTMVFSQAFLYTAKLFNEHFYHRCVTAMDALLKAFEQGIILFSLSL